MLHKTKKDARTKQKTVFFLFIFMTTKTRRRRRRRRAVCYYCMHCTAASTVEVSRVFFRRTVTELIITDL